MEGGSEGEKKKTPEGEPKTKRKMKTASQLEILERTYAVETYPGESLRADLSAKLGLSDRQLQMWFCHRRLKDRKPPSAKRARKDSTAPSTTVAGSTPLAVGPVGDDMGVGEVGIEHGSGSGSGSSPFRHMDSWRFVAGPRAGSAVARIGADLPAMKRYYEPPPPPQQSVVELRAISFVEAQLGEPLREDGPILGMEFDPLPPDAFGALIVPVGQQKQAGRPYEAKLYERSDSKSNKGIGRGGPHEYQFLPEQPAVRTDSYERVIPSHFYSSSVDGSAARASSLSSGRTFMHGGEQAPPSAYGFQYPVPSLNTLPQQSRQGHLLSSSAGEYDAVSRKDAFTNITSMDAHFGSHPINALEIVPSERVSHEDEASRMERKRKSEEARIAREVEAHEKRIRKELEKQDILRRKREEQIRKEMERHDRERRKEEERLLREKQREEERYLREQRRELERREKFLQKESLRAEKMRQKEELRREKEAAKLKAANDRAIARKIAKESMELIEDERLELMELAASSKGLPSILSLDSETLQNLESFRDALTSFPPNSVRLKRPFSFKPWSHSDVNVGNLFMVWRFLITFADVLGLWPFTVDEFVQAFHDYDPRLLNEIHVALLRSIIKDIEDVARTPSTGLGGNPNSAASPSGGHPLIVEGAYAWGFDIRSWQHHLNPLTWPEILRQFALSAGLGPQVKKRSVEQAFVRDDIDDNDGEDIISNLRNGVAAENALSIMQERGFSNPRRSRHRLTPGTVKFAAFHVLSLEGSKGLTILEVAERIQKSGLRDLTTSKTPEASIAAALSRDVKLFERTAPSTYCVRTPYRKDPVDAEEILSAAREKIQIFKNGFSDGEEADDVERDEDSESDVAEDPEVDDLDPESNAKKETQHYEADAFEVKTPLTNGNEAICNEPAGTPLSGVLANASDEFFPLCSDGFNGPMSCGASTARCVDGAGILKDTSTPDEEETDIDESNPGEPWVQGLMEGEYSDLSVEERLNALTTLIGVVIEGNSIRVVLEERLEAANALKKQMWAEAQLDKRRMKEEYVTKMQYSYFMGNKTEQNLNLSEGRQSPFLVEEKSSEASVILPTQQGTFADPHNDNNYANTLATARNLPIQEYSIAPEHLTVQQPGPFAEKSRSQIKSYIGHKAEEMYVYRSLPLGQDRRRNRYWQFVTSASHNDPGCGRIFVELHDGFWRLIDSEEGFDALLTSLDVRGVRESHLHTMLQKIEMSFKETLRRNLLRTSESQSIDTLKSEASEVGRLPDPSFDIDSPSSVVCVSNYDTSEPSTSFAVELGRNEAEKRNAVNKYHDFEKWMWQECFNSLILGAMKYGKKRCTPLLVFCDNCHDVYFLEGNQCPASCQPYGTFTSNSSEHVEQMKEKLMADFECSLHQSESSLPLRVKLLKAQLSLVEVCVLPEALQPVWTESHRKSWGLKLHAASSSENLFQILTMLEHAIKRDFLSLEFETTKELLKSCNLSASAEDYPSHEAGPVLPWVPHTTAAVALRLMELDASIFYLLSQKEKSQKDRGAGDFFKFPSRYAVMKNNQANVQAVVAHDLEYLQEENWVEPGSSGHLSSGRGRGGRGRGRGRSTRGKSQRRIPFSRPDSNIRGTGPTSGRLSQGLAWKGGRSRGRGGRKRGRRSAKSREKLVKREAEIPGGTCIPKDTIFEESPLNLGTGDWVIGESPVMEVGVAENASSDGSDYDDDNGQTAEYEFDDLGAEDYANDFNGEKPEDMLEGSDYNEDEDEEDDRDMHDDDDGDDDGIDDDDGDAEVDKYINGDSDEENGEEEGGGSLRGLPVGDTSSSSEYSD